MAVALVATTCILLFGRAAARADLSALRNPDTWPSPGSGSGLTADLGYGLYQGYNNATSGLNIWKGIRFATSPTGDLRWQAPLVPKTNRSLVHATSFGSVCPQVPRPGVPYQPSADENEDCLFINVYAPPENRDKKLLPVLIWIHGGGYRNGDGRYDLSDIITLNNNTIVGVQIQYRLGAFGFLSSAEVDSHGAVNAGLLDQALALSWVQRYIRLFGGDPRQVTVAGESAGGGSILYHALADDGDTKPELFRYAFASSPSTSPLYPFDAPLPTGQYYSAFAKASGCGNASAVFDCLIRADTKALQTANVKIATDGILSSMSFLPVKDGVLIKELPSIQLTKKRVNGKRLFVGNNAIEGTAFPVGGIINSKETLAFFLQQISPRYSAANITSFLEVYRPTLNLTTTFNTDGLSGATANDVSGIAVGYEQTASNLLAELIFVCPSYWLASAFTSPAQGKAAYHYQYSVPLAGHVEDIYAYFGPAKANQGPELLAAFSRMLVNFVHTGNPSISNEIANGPSAPDPTASNPASNWPAWTDQGPRQINLNTTGGSPIVFTHSWGTGIEFVGPGLRNHFTLVDAYTWEGGRGKRCEFLRDMSPLLPQ